MDHQIEALRRRIKRSTRNGRGCRGYGRELRDEIVAYVLRRQDAGHRQVDIARELGLTHCTICGWVQEAPPVEVVTMASGANSV